MRRYRLLIGIVLVGLAASLAILSTRWAVETRTRTVEVILDAQAWRELAIREGRPPREVFAALHARGATSVAIYEGTLRRLLEAGRASYFSGGDLQDAARAGTLAPPLRALVTTGRVRAEAVYVLADPSVAEWVEEGFRGLLGTGRVRRLGYVLEILGTRVDLEELGLGFLPEELAAYQAGPASFHLVLRPRNYRGLTAENLTRKLNVWELGHAPLTVVFEGPEVLGYERMIDETARHLKALRYRYGRVEAFSAKRKQRGEDALTARMAPAVIRLFSLTPEEMAVLTPAAMEDKFLRAAQERGIRLVYLRPIITTSAGVKAIQANLDFAGGVVQGLKQHGFPVGRPDPLPEILQSPILFGLVAAGALALGAIALSELARTAGVHLEIRHLLILVAAGLLATGLAQVGAGTFLLWRKALALGTAIAGATLAVAVTLAEESSGGVLRRSLGALWRASAISAAAGVLIAALLTAWPFMLAIHTFLGVKVAHVLPPVLAAFLLTFGARPGGERFTLREIWRWLERPLRLQYAVIAVIAAVAAVMLLGRSGNFGLPLSGVESRMRDLLENLLVVRPRTKEFLIGHPAFMLAAAAQALGLRGWVVPLAVIGAVGQAGVINSFSHIHTPLQVVLLRTLYALIIGSILGTVPVLILKRVIRRWRPVPAG